MLTHDNPAARLHKILTEGRNIQGSIGCRQAWAQLLRVQVNDTAELYNALGKIMQLTGLTMELLGKYYPHQIQAANIWRDPIEAAFNNQQIAGQWVTFNQHINDQGLAYLLLVADLLHGKLQSTLLEDDQIRELIVKFTTLAAEVRECDIADQVKLYLLDELETLIRTLDQYHITGAADILKQSEAMIGHIALDKEYRSFLTDNEVGRRLLDQITVAANLLTVSIGLPQLSVAITGLLGK